jgi:proteasome accessory factor C
MTNVLPAAGGQRAPRETDFSKDADKLIRRLSLVAYLLTRRNRPVRAEQIRATVEGYPGMTDDAFKRRFYEDRLELALLGIDIRSETDEDGGEVYTLPAAGYYLPAIDLTGEELLALGSCLLVLEERFAYSKPLRLALLSLAQGRPELLAQEVAPPLAVLTTREALHASSQLPRLQDAIADRKTVYFRYYAIGRDEIAERTVDPYGLLLVGDEWYLVGFCHARKALRTFRLGRIRSRIRYATRRPHDFVVPSEFSLADLRDRPPWQLDSGGPTARIRVCADMAWWVEAHYAHCGAVEPVETDDKAERAVCGRAASESQARGDRDIVYSTRYASARSLVAWVLGMGEAAEILAPMELREMAAAQLDLLLRRIDQPPVHPAGAAGRTGDTPPSGRASAVTASPPAAQRMQAGPGTRGHDDWLVEVDRFTRLTALANYLLAHCGEAGEAAIGVRQASVALGTTPADLRADIRLLNLVNFGGDGALLYAEIKGAAVRVTCDMAGPALAAPARLSPLQADTLLLAVELVGGQVPSAAAGALRSAAAKITAARRGAPPAVEASSAVDASDDILAAVSAAIRDHRLMDIEYWSAGRGAHTSRTVEPYMLVRQRGEWYYVSYCLRSGAIRTFRVGTTKSANLRDERYTPRPEVQLDLYRQGGIPSSAQYAPKAARLWYGPQVARWIAEREHAEKASRGGVVATQPYLDDPWLIHHVLRYGGEAVPLSPPQAVAAVRAAAVELRARYRMEDPARPPEGADSASPDSSPGTRPAVRR